MSHLYVSLLFYLAVFVLRTVVSNCHLLTSSPALQSLFCWCYLKGALCREVAGSATHKPSKSVWVVHLLKHTCEYSFIYLFIYLSCGTTCIWQLQCISERAGKVCIYLNIWLWHSLVLVLQRVDTFRAVSQRAFTWILHLGLNVFSSVPLCSPGLRGLRVMMKVMMMRVPGRRRCPVTPGPDWSSSVAPVLLYFPNWQWMASLLTLGASCCSLCAPPDCSGCTGIFFLL